MIECPLSLSCGQAAILLDQYDADGSKRIELEEFRRLVEQLKRFHASGDDETGRIFHRFDADGSNYIDGTELHAALFSLGLQVDSYESVAQSTASPTFGPCRAF